MSGGGFVMTIGSGPETGRACGDCTLCCTVIPVESLGKPAYQKCQHESCNGCGIYAKLGEMSDCRLWSCRWLVDHRAAELRRPDISHYVVDIMPDFIGVRDDTTGAVTDVPVMQVWCEATFSAAWRDPPLMRLIARMAEEEGTATLIRFADAHSIVVFAPCMTQDGEWHEHGARLGGPTDWVNPLDQMRAYGQRLRDSMP